MTYRQIIEDVRANILDGTWPPGHKLPSRSELTLTYSVAPATVQKAVAVLEGMGLVYGRQGSGVFVAPRPGDPP
jgi:GntR family transcriptional regulator